MEQISKNGLDTLSRWHGEGQSDWWKVASAFGLTSSPDHLLPGRKAMTNLDSVLKSRDITLPTKVQKVQVNGFSSSHVQM